MIKTSPVEIMKILMLRHLVKSSPARTLLLLALLGGAFAAGVVHAQRTMGRRTVRLLTREGRVLEGILSSGVFTVNGALSRDVSVETLLSINLAADASGRRARE